ncbi:MAG: hypothetical protein DRJ47_08830 [Thermoprotei archaeon]|nr:MAG: hypothetical protein DRJ47_08830 [Thermoprotei archaeon]
MLFRKNTGLLLATLVPVFVLTLSFFIPYIYSAYEVFSTPDCENAIKEVWNNHETLHYYEMCPDDNQYKGVNETHEEAYFWYREAEEKIKWSNDPQEWYFDNTPTYCWFRRLTTPQANESGWWEGYETKTKEYNSSYGWVIDMTNDWLKYTVDDDADTICPNYHQEGNWKRDCDTGAWLDWDDNEDWSENCSATGDPMIKQGDVSGQNFPCKDWDDLPTTGWPF